VIKQNQTKSIHKNILIFLTIREMNSSDIAFWKTLEGGLKKNGYQLRLMGYFYQPEMKRLPYKQIPCGLDWTYFFRLASNKMRFDHPFLTSDRYEKYMAQERLWFGNEVCPAHMNLRKNTVTFIYQYFAAMLSKYQPALVVLWNGYHSNQLLIRDLCIQHQIRHAFIERGPFANTLFFDTQGLSSNSSVVNQEYATALPLPYENHLFGELKYNYFREKNTWWHIPG
jgi:hypothetical protein